MVPHVPSAPYNRLRADWRDILRRALAERGLSYRKASLAAGLNETAVSEWLRQTPGHKPKQPSFDSMAKVAAVLNVSMDIFTEGEPGERPEPSTLKQVVHKAVPVVGYIQAGMWQEPEMLTVEDETYVPYIPNPKYTGMRQVAWRVLGPSMNRIAKNGEYIIGVSIIELGYTPPEGSPVVVVRRRGSTYEYTVKRVHYLPAGGAELRPDSEDPRFQEVVWTVNHAEDGDEVEITHLVIGVYRDLGML